MFGTYKISNKRFSDDVSVAGELRALFENVKPRQKLILAPDTITSKKLWMQSCKASSQVIAPSSLQVSGPQLRYWKISHPRVKARPRALRTMDSSKVANRSSLF